MKFVPVPGTNVLFSVWETRVQDYKVFAAETRREWSMPDFEQGPTHPAVNVSWEDAVAFCTWLSKKEGQMYRLPTDAEWSVAVGLGAESGETPEAKSNKAAGYPWDTVWPPPRGAGNFKQELKVDDFAETAPVGSFAEDRHGLYDLSGNVWEWCDDWYNTEKDFRDLRGGSWFGDAETSLRSSSRNRGHPTLRFGSCGFRCVMAVSGG